LLHLPHAVSICRAGAASAILYWDGVSNNQLPYRILVRPSATWIFAEAFKIQQDAEEFCRSAGGTLAVPATAEETTEVDQLLNSTLPYMAKWTYAVSGDYAVWMGLKRINEVWGTMVEEPLGKYTNWGLGEPSKDKDKSCSLFIWVWARAKASWSAYVCG
jgi:hypothetical protein